MSKNNTSIFIIALISLLTLINIDIFAQTPTYTFGVVPQFTSQRTYKIWRPILNELEKLTQLKLKLSGSPNITEFERRLLSGKFDFAYMNPYQALLANNKQGYLPLIRDHEKMLSGILVVRKDSDFKRIQDLKNKTLVYPAPNALGASLLLRSELRNIYHINIKPRYVKSHDSVYMNVYLGQAAAGGGIQKTFDMQDKNIRNELRIIYRSTEVAPHPVSVHPRVPEEIYQQIRDAFLQIGQTRNGRKLIARIPIKKIGVAGIDDYSALDKMKLGYFYVK